jgi:hypothetical protein
VRILRGRRRLPGTCAASADVTTDARADKSAAAAESVADDAATASGGIAGSDERPNFETSRIGGACADKPSNFENGSNGSSGGAGRRRHHLADDVAATKSVPDKFPCRSTASDDENNSCADGRGGY